MQNVTGMSHGTGKKMRCLVSYDQLKLGASQRVLYPQSGRRQWTVKVRVKVKVLHKGFIITSLDIRNGQ